MQNQDLIVPKLKISEKTLFISAFPVTDLNASAISKVYNEILHFIKTKQFQNAVIDLAGITQQQGKAIAFLDASVSLFMKHKITVNITNTPPEVDSVLKELGFVQTSKEVFIRRRKLKSESIFLTTGEASLKFYEDIKSFLGFIGEICSALFYSVLHPRKIQWQEALYYMDRTGADGVPIVFLVCFLMGCILAYQGAVQMGKFGLSIFVSDLVGLAIIKELSALMVSMVCIGRAGSAFAAEIGTMQVSEEIDAMETMGLRTSRFLVIPKIIALAVVMPLLTIVGDVAGILGGTLVGVAKTGVTFQQYYERTITAIGFQNVMEGVTKSIVFAILIACVGCLRGYEAERDAKGVGKAATSSVVSGVFLIVVADGILTMIFN
jgi:phospholipid/cholesterol/gamma-HCH transport system permease protein